MERFGLLVAGIESVFVANQSSFFQSNGMRFLAILSPNLPKKKQLWNLMTSVA
jgi:hypothetical protein